MILDFSMGDLFYNLVCSLHLPLTLERKYNVRSLLSSYLDCVVLYIFGKRMPGKTSKLFY